MGEALIIDAVRTPDGPLPGRALRRAPRRPRRARDRGGGRAHRDRAGRRRRRLLGAANQAGEDNRDVARMASLLAGLPVEVPGVTVNRLCASGLEAVNQASRALRLDEGDLYLAGGVGVDEPRPLGDAEARGGPAPRRADDVRHGARLAAGQPADGRAATRPRRWARPPRTSPSAIRSRARIRTRSRCAATSARSRRRRRGRFAERARRDRGAERPQRTALVEADEGPRADTSLEKLAAPATGVSRGRQRHRGQRLDPQRRRRLPGARLRGQGQRARRRAARPHRRHRRRRRRSRRHGNRAGAARSGAPSRPPASSSTRST